MSEPSSQRQTLKTDETQQVEDAFPPARRRVGVTIASSIRFEAVSHAYGEKGTLKGIDLHIRPGEVVSLLGPSGSGKTTLLRLAAGLARLKSGQIFINDQVVSNSTGMIPPEKRGVGLVFQDFALFPHMTLQKNVEFGLTELDRSERAEHALRMLDTVGLRSRASSYPSSLSGGEQQRVALARALAPKPGILLMDEPFSGLDARLRDSVRNETLALLRETRSTVLMVTHDPEEAMMISDRIALMREGEIVQHGTSEELYHHPNSLFSARFFSELNVFVGVFDGSNVTCPIGRFSPRADQKTPSTGTLFDVCIRPGDFVVHSVTLKTGETIEFDVERHKDSQKISAYVVSKRPVGDVEHLQLALPGTDQIIHAKIGLMMDLGPLASVELSVREDKLFLFEHSPQ